MAIKSDFQRWEPGRCLLTERDFGEAYTRMTAGGIPQGVHRKLATLGARYAIGEVDKALEWMSKP